jgi:hypothetical protein
MARKYYSEEFRRDAVELYRVTGAILEEARPLIPRAMGPNLAALEYVLPAALATAYELAQEPVTWRNLPTRFVRVPRQLDISSSDRQGRPKNDASLRQKQGDTLRDDLGESGQRSAR